MGTDRVKSGPIDTRTLSIFIVSIVPSFAALLLSISRPGRFIEAFYSLSLGVAMAKAAATSLFQNLRRFIKKPWEITGVCSDPEYMGPLRKVAEYRVRCPATPEQQAIIPTSNPETVYDIKYYSRDQRRNRPPIRRTILKKADVEMMMKEKTFDVTDFPPVFLTGAVEEDINAVGGGYQK